MLLNPIITQLATQCPALLAVSGAVELARDIMIPRVMPAAYVLNVREQVGQNDFYTGAISHPITCTIGVVVMHKDVSDQFGLATNETIDGLIRDIRTALVGFTPPNVEDATPLELSDYQLIDFANQIVIVQQNFTTQYLFRKSG